MTTASDTHCGVLIVSGPSGAGKSTICHGLCETIGAVFGVSVTTRSPRPGEVDGQDYAFVTPEAFEALRARDGLLEWAEVYGHHYGTPRAMVDANLEAGRLTVLEIDVEGCRQVCANMPNARAVFVLTPSPDEQKRRIEGRKTDRADAIRERLAKAEGEIRRARDSGCYDAFVINEKLDQTIEDIVKLIRQERPQTCWKQ